MSAVFETVNQDWASGLDGRGKPGSDSLKAWREAVKAAGQNN